MTRWAEVLDWFKEFQQVLEKKVAEESVVHPNGFVLERKTATQAAPIAQTTPVAQPTGVVLEERTMPQAAAQEEAAAQTAVPVDEAAEQRKREGAALAQALRLQGMHGSDLASMLGVTNGTVSNWVTGKHRIDYERIAKCQVLPQKFRLTMLAATNKESGTLVARTKRMKSCKSCGKQFVARGYKVAFCPGCELHNKKCQTAFFALFPQARKVLRQRYHDMSSILASWVSQNSPVPCTKDLIAKECGEDAGTKFGQAFNCKNVCGGSKATWCIGQKCKYHRDMLNKIPIGGTL